MCVPFDQCPYVRGRSDPAIHVHTSYVSSSHLGRKPEKQMRMEGVLQVRV